MTGNKEKERSKISQYTSTVRLAHSMKNKRTNEKKEKEIIDMDKKGTTKKDPHTGQRCRPRFVHVSGVFFFFFPQHEPAPLLPVCPADPIDRLKHTINYISHQQSRSLRLLVAGIPV